MGDGELGMNPGTEVDDEPKLHSEAWKEIRELKMFRHKLNKNSGVDGFICCANCGKTFKKKYYQTQFCSNKGPRNCKDGYWNSIDPLRHKRLYRVINE